MNPVFDFQDNARGQYGLRAARAEVAGAAFI